MSSVMDTGNIIVAVSRIRSDLPALIGEEAWVTIGQTLEARIEQLRHNSDLDERRRAAMDIVGLIAPYADARERLRAEVHFQAALRTEIESDLTAIASELGVDASNVGLSTSVVLQSVSAELVEPIGTTELTRLVTLKPGGLGGGKSLKFNNLNLDFGEMSELAAGMIITGSNIIDKPHPIVIAVGVLLTIRSLTKSMTVVLSERDASVFWGFIQARGEDNTTTEAAILEHTNKERENVGLELLTEKQLKSALHTLKSLKSVDTVVGKPGTWRIIERYKIKN